MRRVIAALLVVVVAGAALSGCALPDNGSGEATIALLLPDKKTARYETFDRPVFEARVAELGDVEVLYTNADQDAARQQQQAESALAAGARVLVLDPVDGRAAASILASATAEGVPVIAYDRMIVGGGTPAFYVSFDNERVGELQAEALVDELTARGEEDGGILMVHGAPTDSNAGQFREGARRVVAEAGLRVLAEYDTPDWSPDKAQAWVAGQLAQYGDEVVGVYAANDGTASGAVAALRAADVTPFPVVTGQDAELSALQRIVSGDQYMTVYKALRAQATIAADAAVALLNGDDVDAATTIDGIPATLLEPVAVTVDDIAETVVADGFWTVADICTPAYAEACAAAGLE
ncbi:substrate-binding domain-containing protein [Microbacterium sp. EYE_5]|uniref:substrate-binding domain-containing protein n=1 Tax=unclassified Microbacterium TaxID=2609290 RepID=UPI0020051307|nr:MULTISPECIES: substrate-binding domain-containing protein [unclassified Microbacterium]MCK6081181.1 substrate-binding domain-containing protein [Microbacterium sp. EYE_382]MCK6086451.1 substrate-binding domain-containing protein [Microbacterium sp. EYE_384]MCK6124051.1 substrate-binding domain-containing protein [Microbacterium sp. EYE_80]MCK6126960.1 substrate-binding domain-containing protein [Microbacterium sp. EYE_79]MCK6142136.1 substrate-binding domain-containing protein [Microbacteri